jgi:hypothetical protein
VLQTYLAAAVLAASALVAAGCGGSSKGNGSAATSTAASTTTSPTTGQTAIPVIATGEPIKLRSGKPLSRKEWVARGDAVCTIANKKLDSSIVRTLQDWQRVLPQAAGWERVEAMELSKIVPPAAFAGDWQQIVTGVQRFSEYTAKAGEYALVNNMSAAQPVTAKGEAVREHTANLAKRYGFKECSIA